MKNFKFNGKIYGIYIDYRKNGNIFEKGYYKNNKRYFITYYYENGNIEVYVLW